MKIQNKFLLAIFLISLCVSPLFAREFSFGPGRFLNRPCEPHLVCPIYDIAIITGNTLEFKWWHARIGIDRYEFNLYKGSQMYSDNLILHKILPFTQSSLEVDANKFENGQVYTWSLLQASDSGLKSERSFITFKVIKK